MEGTQETSRQSGLAEGIDASKDLFRRSLPSRCPHMHSESARQSALAFGASKDF